MCFYSFRTSDHRVQRMLVSLQTHDLLLKLRNARLRSRQFFARFVRRSFLLLDFQPHRREELFALYA